MTTTVTSRKAPPKDKPKATAQRPRTPLAREALAREPVVLQLPKQE